MKPERKPSLMMKNACTTTYIHDTMTKMWCVLGRTRPQHDELSKVGVARLRVNCNACLVKSRVLSGRFCCVYRGRIGGQKHQLDSQSTSEASQGGMCLALPNIVAKGYGMLVSRS